MNVVAIMLCYKYWFDFIYTCHKLQKMFCEILKCNFVNLENFRPHCVKGRKDESVPKLRSPKDDASSKLEKSDVQTIRA